MPNYDHTCQKCSARLYTDQLETRTKVFANGTKHLEGNCPHCHGHIKWFSTSKPSGSDVMPFGKYKGKSVEEIVKQDYQYAVWAACNLDAKRYRESFQSLVTPQDAEPMKITIIN